MRDITEYIDFDFQKAFLQLEGLHNRLCPRQVLGVRIGILGGRLLNVEVPQKDKRLLAFMETDGCAADGVAVASGCCVGRRTMRILDFGKVAATFVDLHSGRAFRIAPQPGIRETAWRYAPDARDPWTAQLEGYRVMPASELLWTQTVTLMLNLDELISMPGLRATCEVCGEEIMNQREIIHEGAVLCRTCNGEAYYRCVPITDRVQIPA